MRFVIILFALLIILPAQAGETTPLDKYLENLPPLPTDVRKTFDKAARSMYQQECNCQKS